MSDKSFEVVRQPIALSDRPRRPLDERFSVRFPRLFGLVARAISRLPPRSRIRQALLRRGVQLGFEALTRGDFDAGFLLFDRDFESIFPSQLAVLGGDESIRGRDERIRFQRTWTDEWGAIRYGAEEIIDMGDRVLVLGRIAASGLRSGAAVDSDWAWLFTAKAGLVVREEHFANRNDALEAAGLAP